MRSGTAQPSSARRLSAREIATTSAAAFGLGAALTLSEELTVQLAALGCLALVIVATLVGIERLAFGLVAVGIALVTLNALRPFPGMTIADLVLVGGLGLALLRGATFRLPSWLLLATGTLGVAVLAVELFPPERPSQAAMFFPGGVFSESSGITTATLSNLDAGARLVAAMLILPLAISAVATTPSRIRALVDSWIFGVAFGSLVGVMAYVGLLGDQSLVGGDPGLDVTRIRGLTVHPNAFGLVAAMALPVAVLLTGQGTERGARSWWYGVAVVLLVAAIGVSGSRGALLGAVFGIFVIVALTADARLGLRRVGLVGVAIVAIAGIATFEGSPTIERLVGSGSPDAEVTVENRAEIYPEVWREVQERPLVGWGFEYVRGSHNIYLQLLHAGGLIAVLGVIILAAGVVRTGLSTPVPLARALVASAAVWLFAVGLFQPAVFDRHLYVPIGLLVATSALAAADRKHFASSADRRNHSVEGSHEHGR